MPSHSCIGFEFSSTPFPIAFYGLQVHVKLSVLSLTLHHGEVRAFPHTTRFCRTLLFPSRGWGKWFWEDFWNHGCLRVDILVYIYIYVYFYVCWLCSHLFDQPGYIITFLFINMLEKCTLTTSNITNQKRWQPGGERKSLHLDRWNIHLSIPQLFNDLLGLDLLMYGWSTYPPPPNLPP